MSGRVLPIRPVEGVVDEMSDEALLAACALGDTAALGALFDRHHGTVYRFINRLSQVAPDDVDDLVQSTFLTVQRSARKYGGRSAVRTWILGIAVNVVRREARSRGRRRRLWLAAASEPAPRPSAPDEVAAHRQSLRRFEAALSDLSPKLRTCFVLCQLEGVPGPEAAQTLGLRLGTLYGRIHEARQQLRAAMGGEP